MSKPANLFAVVPAAGYSRRMGRPKLLLPLGDRPVISRMLEALDHPGITETVVVVRPDDDALVNELKSTQATVCQPSQAPIEMRDSVSCGLASIRERYSPMPTDGWLLIPGDHPLLSRDVLAALISRWNHGDCRILVPSYQQRRGHPSLFRWDLAGTIDNIPSNCGLNWLVQQFADDVTELAVHDVSVVTDLDSPSDYATLLRDWSDT